VPSTRVAFRRRRASARQFRIFKPHWVDPFPFIPGTEPEKRIFEALVRRRFYFIFQGDLPELTSGYRERAVKRYKEADAELRKLEQEIVKHDSLTKRDKANLAERARLLHAAALKRAEVKSLLRKDKGGTFLYEPAFKPDFVLPEYRVIIDPFGIFHHSLPDAVKRDAVKLAVYESLGYAFCHPWWDDKGFLLEHNNSFERVGFDALAVLDSIPELSRPPKAKLEDPLDIAAKRATGYRLGQNLGLGASSVAIANHKRKRSKPLGLRPSGRRRRVRHRL
jgi:hypothetical protein